MNIIMCFKMVQVTAFLLLIFCLKQVSTGVLSNDQMKYKQRTIGFSSAKSPSGPDDRATYQFVDIQEIPQDEILNSEQNRNNDNEEDEFSSLLNDKNWPQPIPVNGPNSNKNIGGLLNKIANKWLEDKKSAYSKDFGTFVGRMSPRAHQISGLVYAVDEQNLFIRNFWYDGTGPDAYFWVGNTRIPTPKGWVVPYPPIDIYSDVKPSSKAGKNAAATEVPKLKKMKNKDILLTLPGTLKVRDINWLSVWCMRFTVNYGEVYIPKDLKIPEKVTLSSFSADSNGKLNSGPITILDATSFYIRNLRLYIEEPGYHFWVGNSSFMTPNRDGFMVANDKARFDDLGSYMGDDVIITLPKGLTMFDINYLSIFNDQTGDNLGHIQFDVRNNQIPPALGQTKIPGWWFDIPTPTPPAVVTNNPTRSGASEMNKPEYVAFNHTLKLPNCRELLGRKIRLLWMQDGTEVYFRIKVHMDLAQYAAVGIAAEGSPLIDADFVRIFFNQSANQFATQDAFLSKQLNCDFITGGLCTDEQHNFKDHVTFMGAMKNHGLAVIDFKRSIMPHDSVDAPIPMEGPVQVIVAIGRMTSNREGYSVNTPLTLETENVTINFASSDNFCPNSETNLENKEMKVEGWDRNYIKDKDLFVAQLGPTGGQKGYGTITGTSPSEKSVCWWINGKIMPEIYVYRGRTYYFRVQGGDGYQHVALNNPLYITDHRDGGYGQKSDYEKERETIFEGVQHGQATGVGTLCEYTSIDGADKADQSETFEDYKQTLQVACERNRVHDYGWVNWTVAESTPDLVYYQSFYGYGMGWKIHVLDEGEEPSSVTRVFCSRNQAIFSTFIAINLVAYLLN